MPSVVIETRDEIPPAPASKAAAPVCTATPGHTERFRDPAEMDPEAADGFSGAGIEQVIVSSLYVTHAQKTELETALLPDELDRTKPLSVVMAERIASRRQWAAGRTLPSD